MRLSFNEISVQPFCNNGASLYKNFEAILNNYSYLQKTFGYNHIIVPDELFKNDVIKGETFMEWFSNLTTPQRNKIQPLFLKRPFSDEVLGNTIEADRCFFECADPIIPQQFCKGLATAYLLGIPALSIGTHDLWKKNKVKFYEYDDNGNKFKSIYALNVSSKNVKNNLEIIEYSKANYKVDLLKSKILVGDKEIKLSGDHHGNDKLKILAKRIIKNEYVDGVLNNLPFDSHTSLFLRKVKKNGIVEITMHWEDKGFGMAIQTTGRNLMETEKIAKMLRTKFDK